MEKIPKSMILKVRNSKAVCEESLQIKKAEKVLKGNEDVKMKRLVEEIESLRRKKLKILADNQKKVGSIDQRGIVRLRCHLIAYHKTSFRFLLFLIFYVSHNIFVLTLLKNVMTVCKNKVQFLPFYLQLLIY